MDLARASSFPMMLLKSQMSQNTIATDRGSSPLAASPSRLRIVAKDTGTVRSAGGQPGQRLTAVAAPDVPGAPIPGS
jgi:hypothetical protein